VKGVLVKMENPYVYGPVIGIRGTFIGREKETEAIFKSIRMGMSKSVVGERRIGKSSLLYHLIFADMKEEYLSGAEQQHVLSYFDCQGEFYSYELKEDELLDMLFENALTAMNDLPERVDFEKTYKAAERKRHGFQDAIAMLSEHGVQLTYLLDEFELITTQTHLHDATIDFLRSMANNPNHIFAYITATQTSLRDLCKAEKIKSPFWNIFSRLQLGLMPKQEASGIVELGGEDFCNDVKDFVLEKAGRHPYLIQMMCGILFELRNRGTGFEQSHLDEGLLAFRRESRDYFEGCWQQYLNDEDKLTLKQIIAVGEPASESSTDKRRLASVIRLPLYAQERAKTLTERGYLEYINDKYRIFSSVFEDFVRSRKGVLRMAQKILEYEEDVRESVFIVISRAQDSMSLEEIVEAASKYVAPEIIPSVVQVLKEKKYIEESDGRFVPSKLGQVRYE